MARKQELVALVSRQLSDAWNNVLWHVAKTHPSGNKHWSSHQTRVFSTPSALRPGNSVVTYITVFPHLMPSFGISSMQPFSFIVQWCSFQNVSETLCHWWLNYYSETETCYFNCPCSQRDRKIDSVLFKLTTLSWHDRSSLKQELPRNIGCEAVSNFYRVTPFISCRQFLATYHAALLKNVSPPTSGKYTHWQMHASPVIILNWGIKFS